DTGEVLMLAWMNREAVRVTLTEGRACYWSRSRQALWRKGETSGQVQRLRERRLDCDGDAVLLLVDQHGVACHTGRRSCFFRAWRFAARSAPRASTARLRQAHSKPGGTGICACDGVGHAIAPAARPTTRTTKPRMIECRISPSPGLPRRAHNRGARD